MSYRRFLILLILLCPVAVQAATKHNAVAAAKTSKSSPPASSSANGPAPSIEPGEVMRGRFTEEHWIKGLSQPVHSEGHFLVAPGHGLIWAVEKPLPIAFIVTNNGLTQTINGVPMIKQKSSSNPFLGHVSGMLAAALGGDWKRLEPDMTITRAGDAKQWKVKMSPRATSSVRMPFRELTVTGARYAEKASVLRQDGLTDSYVFRDHEVSKGPLTDKEERSFALITE